MGRGLARFLEGLDVRGWPWRRSVHGDWSATAITCIEAGDVETPVVTLSKLGLVLTVALCLPIEERAELAERTLGAFLATHSPS